MMRSLEIGRAWARGRPSPMPLSRWLGTVVACMILALGLPAAAQADVPTDFLVQQVCDDGQGGHTSADPVTCPDSARKLRVGESLPYHKWDGSDPNAVNQIADEFPVADLWGRQRVISTFFYDQRTNFRAPFFDLADPQAHNSSYDLFGSDGNYVAGMGTYDIGRGWQPFFSNANCSLADAWLMFPKNGSIPLAQGSQTATLVGQAPQCSGISGFAQAATYWDFYNITFESGKTLPAIKSWHFGGPSINSNAIEVFYFTKEYGKTRWEAWRASSQVSGPNPNVVAKCPNNTDNGVAYFGSTTYYLVDCHDWSYIYADPNGGWDPNTWHVDPLYTSYNLLNNTHMQCTGSNGKAKDCNAGGACQTISPWNRSGNLNWGYTNFPQLEPSANCGLQFSIPSDFDGSQSVYQDTQFVFDFERYYFGAAVWTPYNSSGGVITITAYEMDSGYNVLARHDVTANLTNNRAMFKGSFVKNPNTAHMRFQFYPQTTHFQYVVSDSFLAPQP